MNAANDKYGSSLDRTLGAGKPVDPATRLSELLAQSLEELTRPFDPPRPGPQPSRPAEPRFEAPPPVPAPPPEQAAEPVPEPSPEHARVDADKALAELEAELFAAAKQVDRDTSIPRHEKHEEEHAEDHSEDHPGEHSDRHLDALERTLLEPPPSENGHADEKADAPIPGEVTAPLAPAAATAEPPADASGVIAKVRRLMLISMAVTVIAVGSVFGFIGYRIFKGEGSVEKRADKLPAAPAIPTEVTLSLPRGAKLIQSAVANDRLVMTLEIDGKIEVRTFDVNTLAPAGRLDFSATP
jgi:hypothetical protein